MEVVYPRCCGLDVHKKLVVACRIVPGADGQPTKEIERFGTMTQELLRLSDWLSQAGITHVAMESTGVYWKPLYNLLEGSFELLLVNAAHLKAVPGRKTDVKDSEWLADLLRHGLVRGSFVPDRNQRELRELTRYRTSLVRERAAEVNRIQKTLEGANIKLASVATDIAGVSGRQILAALVAGQTEAATMAQLAKGRMRQKLPELEQALVGQFEAHQRFLVARQLAHVDYLDSTIAELSAEISRRLEALLPPPPDPEPPRPMARENEAGTQQGTRAEPLLAGPGEGSAPPEASPFTAAVCRLSTIPGVGECTAEKLVAEIGLCMSRFPTARHLASWAGMCPGNHESGGKRKSGKTRKGSRWLREALVEAAHSAGRSKGTYLGAQYRRLVARRGKKKGAIAVGHTILVIAYHLLKNQTAYQELGEQYFDERDRDAVQRRLVQRLEKLGCKVTIEPAIAA